MNTLPSDKHYQELALIFGGTFVKRQWTVNGVTFTSKAIYMGEQDAS